MSPDTSQEPGVDLKEVALITAVVIAMLVATVLAYFLLDVLLLFFLGVVVAAAVQPWHVKLCALGLPRSLAVLAIYLVFLVGIVSICLLIGPAIVEQLTTFVGQIPTSYADFLSALRSSSVEPVRVIGRRLPSFDAMLRSAADVTPQVYESALGLTSSIIGVFTFFITVIVVAFYWTLELPRLERLFVSLLPVARRARALEIWHEIESKLGAYIRGQGIAMLVIGVASGIGYLIIGLPNAFVLAVLAGLLEAIPLVGPVLAAVPAILVAMPLGLTTVLLVIGLATLLQGLENNVLIPRIMHHATGVSALVSIFAVLALGALYGIFGVFIAVPIAAVGQVLLDRVLLDKAPAPEAAAAALQGDPLAMLRARVNQLQQRVRARLRARKSRMGIDPNSVDHVVDAVDQEIEAAVERVEDMIGRAEQQNGPLMANGHPAVLEALEAATDEIEAAVKRVDDLAATQLESKQGAAELSADDLEAARRHAQQAVQRVEAVLAETAAVTTDVAPPAVAGGAVLVKLSSR